MKRIVKTLIFLFFSISFSQKNANEDGIFIGQKISLFSEKIGEDLTLHIYLPPSYSENIDRRYPVLYVLDAQEYFLHPIAYQNMLRFRDKTPEFIVVGIPSDRKKRRVLYYRQSKSFINFLSQELVPHVDKKFRTLKKERMLFGWEMAGGLAMETFILYPGLFNAFFVASPSHLTQARIQGIRESLDGPIHGKTYFHIVESEEDTTFGEGAKTTDSLIKSRAKNNITSHYRVLSGEDHYSTPNHTIHTGLYEHFKDYIPLRFFSLKEFDEFGDLNSIKRYYEKRAERYDVAPAIHRQTKHYLLLHSMNDRDYPRFKKFANAYKDYLVGGLRLPFWVNRFGQFCLSNNDDSRALEIYTAGIAQFPKDYSLRAGLGDVHLVQGQKQKARNAYEQALNLMDKEEHKATYEKYTRKLKKIQ